MGCEKGVTRCHSILFLLLILVKDTHTVLRPFFFLFVVLLVSHEDFWFLVCSWSSQTRFRFQAKPAPIILLS